MPALEIEPIEVVMARAAGRTSIGSGGGGFDLCEVPLSGLAGQQRCFLPATHTNGIGRMKLEPEDREQLTELELEGLAARATELMNDIASRHGGQYDGCDLAVRTSGRRLPPET